MVFATHGAESQEDCPQVTAELKEVSGETEPGVVLTIHDPYEGPVSACLKVTEADALAAVIRAEVVSSEVDVSNRGELH